MARTFSLSRSSLLPFSQTKRATSSINPKVVHRLHVGLIVLTIVLGIVYLMQINTMTVAGYQIQEMQSQLQLLQQEQASLQHDYLGMQSLESLEQRALSADYVALDNVKYVQSVEQVVAQNK